MAELLVVDQAVVGSTPIVHPIGFDSDLFAFAYFSVRFE